MKFAKIVFLVAGVYGLLVMLPQYFIEDKIAPPLTHPEFFYGFIGVVIAWQVLFLVISREPLRYRPAMIPAMLEKAGFVIAVTVLYFQHRVAPVVLAPTAIDLLLGILFVLAFFKTRLAAKGESQ